MDTHLLANLLNGALCLISLFITMRSIVLYLQLRSARLFILALSMCTIAITAAADTLSGNSVNIRLNTDWFLYIGQTVSWGYIFLSLFCSSELSQRRLLLWQIVTTVPLLLLLFFASSLPNFPNPTVQAILSGSRCLVCFLIFTRYIFSFIFTKETRFSLLMSAAFLSLSLGYFLILPSLLLPHGETFDQVGDIVRIAGLVVLLVAYLQG